MTDTARLGLPYVPENTLDPAAGLNLVVRDLDALVQAAVIRMDLTAPPGTSSDGDTYIVAGPATGAWAGHENAIAYFVQEGLSWVFFEAGEAVHLVLNLDDLGLYKFNPGSPGGWTLAAGLGDAPADGDRYARQDNAWVVTGAGVLVTNEDSPPTIEPQATEVIIGDGLELEVLTGGQVRLSSPGGAGGALQFVDDAVVAGAAATNITIAGLDLAADECYEVDFDIGNATASLVTVSVFFNGDTVATNYDRRISFDGAGTGTPNDAAVAGLTASSAVSGRLIIRPDFNGRPRTMVQASDGNTTGLNGQVGTHLWRTAANVTSITFNSSPASAFAIGSKVRIWKRTT
jgi:hypothetical protein